MKILQMLQFCIGPKQHNAHYYMPVRDLRAPMIPEATAQPPLGLPCHDPGPHFSPQAICLSPPEICSFCSSVFGLISCMDPGPASPLAVFGAEGPCYQPQLSPHGVMPI